MVYAPIGIATLNRHKHLQELIHSLQINSWAKYTELYISLDYPPSDYYREGYLQIKELLSKGIEGFKAVHIFEQKENLGSSKNEYFIICEMFKHFERSIVTEDDNVFSPNFIEYMDRCLDQFKDDQSVARIAGYLLPGKWNMHGSNIMKMPLGWCWGVGIWKDRWIQSHIEINNNFLDYICKHPHLLWKLQRKDAVAFYWIVHNYLIEPHSALVDENGEVKVIDISLRIWGIIKNKTAIVPSISKVNNNGWDGSGINCGQVDENNVGKVPLDSDKTFQLQISNRKLKPERDNCKIFANTSLSAKFRDNYKVWQNYFLYRILGRKRYFLLINRQKQ